MKKIKADFERQTSFKRRTFFHQPVLLHEAIDFLNVKPGQLYLDATCGGGGHSRLILEKGGQVLGLDCDPEAVEYAKEFLRNACPALNSNVVLGPNASFNIIKANFSDLGQIAAERKFAGIIFDLGVSSHQLRAPGRGFSFLRDEPLDMRLDPGLQVKAVDLVNGFYEGELNELFSKLGEEPLAKPIAQAIIKERQRGPIKTTRELAKIVTHIYKTRYKERSKIHPATKVFQALRIAVNDELKSLEKALEQTRGILKKQGRLVVISFHGLEDKLVKNFLKKGSQERWLEILTKKPVIPTICEAAVNPRARSAKLRAAEKIA